mmetsp:Transcript_1717/g.2015  ORF Transcript_1717/g.2015 Transcript_1717/m.2015 type:complete len:97 (+) Transcript_1717:669-959(+)
MTSMCQDVRSFGSAAISICCLASGEVDCYAELCPKEWDIAAALLILYEAGGCAANYDNTPMGDMHSRQCAAAGTTELLKSLCDVLHAPEFDFARYC